MRQRTLAILGGAAALSIVSALLLSPGDPAPPSGAGKLAFEGLAPRLQAATRIEIAKHDGKLVLERRGDSWVVADDRGGYPVRPERVRELLVGLTEVRLLEPRTADPAMHERLGVEDPSKPGSTGLLVRVQDAKNEPVAELVVGRRRVRTQGNLPESAYIRRPAEAQSWLAEGRLPVDADPQLWLDRDVVNLLAARVREVAVKRPGEPELVLARGEDAVEGAKLALVAPTAHQATDASALDEVARALEFVTFLDVKAEAATPSNAVGEGRFTLDNGLVVVAAAYRGEGDALWLRLRAEGAAAAEAERLNARWRGWAYQVGTYKEKALLPRLADIGGRASVSQSTTPPPAAARTAPEAATPARAVATEDHRPAPSTPAVSPGPVAAQPAPAPAPAAAQQQHAPGTVAAGTAHSATAPAGSPTPPTAPAATATSTTQPAAPSAAAPAAPSGHPSAPLGSSHAASSSASAPSGHPPASAGSSYAASPPSAAPSSHPAPAAPSSNHAAPSQSAAPSSTAAPGGAAPAAGASSSPTATRPAAAPAAPSASQPTPPRDSASAPASSPGAASSGPAPKEAPPPASASPAAVPAPASNAAAPAPVAYPQSQTDSHAPAAAPPPARAASPDQATPAASAQPAAASPPSPSSASSPAQAAPSEAAGTPATSARDAAPPSSAAAAPTQQATTPAAAGEAPAATAAAAPPTAAPPSPAQPAAAPAAAAPGTPAAKPERGSNQHRGNNGASSRGNQSQPSSAAAR